MSELPLRDREGVRIRIWDLPVRLFHWLIVILFAFSWWTADNDKLDWHMRSGYIILTLVLFRIYWGFAGSTTARFLSFLKGPRAFLDYARRLSHRSGHVTPGHNPMGGWSVVLLLLLLLIQTILGLFAVDEDVINSGPLSNLVTYDTGRLLTKWHGRVFDYLLILIGLHVAFVAFYLVYKRENLVAAMVGGFKRMPENTLDEPLRFKTLFLAIPGLIVAAAIVALIVYGRF